MLDPSLKQALHTTRGRVMLVLAALALAATAALGGFRAAPPKRTGVVGAGERAVSGALAVQPLRAWADHTDPRGLKDLSGQDVLVLEAVVENLTDASSSYYLMQNLRWLTSPEDNTGQQADRVYLADDLSLYDSLHPRLSVRLFLCWKLPKGQALPQPVCWGLYQRRYVEKAYINNESGWTQDGPGFSLKLDAQDRRTEAAP